MKTAHIKKRPHAIRIASPRSSPRLPPCRTKSSALLMPARSVIPCGSRYHRISSMMSSDALLDTVPCLPYRQSSRLRPGIISYRIPDDTATQSITCDTGYDDIPFPPRPISSLLLLPAPLPASPCRQTGRLKARRHPVRCSLRLLARLVPSHRLIHQARCLPPLRHMRLIHLIHLIRSATSHRLISRPAQLPALLPAERPASSPRA